MARGPDPATAIDDVPTRGPRWWRSPWPWLVLVLVLAGAGATAFFLTRSDDAGAEVFLEPSASRGDDPFTDSVATDQVDVEGGGVQQVEGGDDTVEAVEGASPGLYGGTGDQAVCDGDALASFLERNPDKGRAFAGALGIEQDGIRDYIEGLTPVVLREDTRVTNHGFENGRATPHQAVLQAGTAVMVDDRGVPRVRCACGNPLTEPEPVESRPAFTGERWEGFDDERLVVVSAADEPVDSFELVDVRTGERYEQPVGAGGPAQPIVMGDDGSLVSVGEWETAGNSITVDDAAEGLGVEFEESLDAEGTCVYTAAAEGLTAFTPDYGRGAGGDCIPGGQAVFDLRITSEGYETEEGLRVGMSEDDLTRLYPDAEPVDPQSLLGDEPGEETFGLVTKETPFGPEPVATLMGVVKDGEVVALVARTDAFLAAE